METIILAISITLAGSLLGATGARSAEVATPLLRKQVGDDFRCLVYNAGKKPIEVSIQIWDPVNLIGVPANRTIPPQRSTSVVTEFPFVATCRVEGKFSRKKTLVTLCTSPVGTAECTAAVTTP